MSNKGADTCVLAAIASTAHSAVVLDNLHLGYGKHLWDIRATTLSALSARQLSSTSVICPIAICLFKITLLLLYLRTLGTHRQLYLAVRLGIYVCGLFYSTFFGLHLAFVIKCTSPDGICDTAYYLDVFQSTFSTCTDIYVFLVPLPHVVNLRLSRSQKMGLLLVVFAGFITCLLAIGRLLLIAFNFNTADRFWNAAIAANLTYAAPYARVDLTLTTW